TVNSRIAVLWPYCCNAICGKTGHTRCLHKLTASIRLLMFRRIFARLSEPQAASPWSLLDASNALSVLLVACVLIGPTLALLVLNDPQAQLVTAPLLGWLLGCVLT